MNRQESYLSSNRETDLSEVREGGLTKSIEEQTAKIPSAAFLALAGGAAVVSLFMTMSSRRRDWGSLLGNLVPSIMLLGIYNKIVKTHGHDIESESESELKHRVH